MSLGFFLLVAIMTAFSFAASMTSRSVDSGALSLIAVVFGLIAMLAAWYSA